MLSQRLTPALLAMPLLALTGCGDPAVKAAQIGRRVSSAPVLP